MSYLFSSKNSDLHFSINNERMFHELLSYVKDSLRECDVDINLRDIVTQLTETDSVFINKHTTKILCNTLEKDNNSIWEFEYINKLLNDELDSKKTRMSYIIFMMNFIRFIKFLKNTRSGFVISKIDDTNLMKKRNEELMNIFFSEPIRTNSTNNVMNIPSHLFHL